MENADWTGQPPKILDKPRNPFYNENQYKTAYDL